jgi:hypothetical protein
MMMEMKKMNFSKLIGIIIGLSLILACSAAAVTDSGALLSPKTIGTGIVKENIQKFTESPDAVVTYKGMKEFSMGKMYEVATNAGDMYYVNANTGDIEVAMIRNAVSTKSMKVKDIGGMKEPVQKFVEKNYRNFNTKKMTLVDSKIIEHGDAAKEYEFYWNEMSGEAYTLSSVKVSVYPDRNNTITYVAFDRPLLVDTTPEVSRANAETTALSTLKMGAAATTTSKLVVRPSGDSQKLVWLVNTVQMDDEGYSYGGIVTVDAISGEVLSVNPVL